jgi:Lon protease-like protein
VNFKDMVRNTGHEVVDVSTMEDGRTMVKAGSTALRVRVCMRVRVEATGFLAFKLRFIRFTPSFLVYEAYVRVTCHVAL